MHLQPLKKMITFCDASSVQQILSEKKKALCKKLVLKYEEFIKSLPSEILNAPIIELYSIFNKKN